MTDLLTRIRFSAALIDRRNNEPKIISEHLTNPRSAQLSRTLFSRYNDLSLPDDKIMATYIWIDSTGEYLRSNTRTLKYIPKVPKGKLQTIVDEINENYVTELNKEIKGLHENKHKAPYYCPEDFERVLQVSCRHVPKIEIHTFDENYKILPVWHYDGSETGHAVKSNADTYLIPRAIYNDPFLCGKNVLVLCDTYNNDLEPTESNRRINCQRAYEMSKEDEPWFSIRQEYVLMNSDRRPLGWPKCGFPQALGPYFCAVGSDKIIARDLIDSHVRCCIHAGVPIRGTTAEVMASQWAFEMGPSLGVSACDDHWVARYILVRLAEEYGADVSFDPKPVEGWQASGAYFNFSTKMMRQENGIVEIENAIFKLSRAHMKHLKVYDSHGGEDNKRRLLGNNVTSDYNVFSVGVANTKFGINLTRDVVTKKSGYLQDCRPASNSNPYSVCDALMRTCILDK